MTKCQKAHAARAFADLRKLLLWLRVGGQPVATGHAGSHADQSRCQDGSMRRQLLIAHMSGVLLSLTLLLILLATHLLSSMSTSGTRARSAADGTRARSAQELMRDILGTASPAKTYLGTRAPAQDTTGKHDEEETWQLQQMITAVQASAHNVGQCKDVRKNCTTGPEHLHSSHHSCNWPLPASCCCCGAMGHGPCSRDIGRCRRGIHCIKTVLGPPEMLDTGASGPRLMSVAVLASSAASCWRDTTVSTRRIKRAILLDELWRMMKLCTEML